MNELTNQELTNAVKRLTGGVRMLTRIVALDFVTSLDLEGRRQLILALTSLNEELLETAERHTNSDPRFVDGQEKVLQEVQQLVQTSLPENSAD